MSGTSWGEFRENTHTHTHEEDEEETKTRALQQRLQMKDVASAGLHYVELHLQPRQECDSSFILQGH